METAGDPGSSLSQQCCSCVTSSSRCWCVDCSEALCDDCVMAHRRVTVTRSHRILNQPPGDVSAPPTKFCRLHPSEPLKLFCFTCYQYTCRDCQLMDHMNHSYQFVTEALDSLKKQLEAWVHPIRAQRDTVRRSLQDMQTRLQDIVQGESQVKAELQQSYNMCAQILQKRMNDILEEVKKASQSEAERIRRRMERLQQLQERQLLLTETTDKARSIQELSTLLTCSEHIKCQLKTLPDQDPCPPQTMSQLQVIVDRKSMETILNFGELKVTRIPFSVSQTSNQNTPDTSTSSPAITPPTSISLAPTCKTLPQTRTTTDPASPVPVNHPSSSSKALSLPPPPKTRTSNDTVSPLSVSCPPPSSRPNLKQPICPMTTSGVFIPTQPVKPETLSALKTNQSQVVLMKNQVQPVCTTVSKQTVGSIRSLSKGPSQSCTVVNLIQSPLVLSQPPRQNQPTTVLLNGAHTVDQVSSCPITPCQTVSCAPLSVSRQKLPEASAENSVGQSSTAADKSSAVPTGLLDSQHLVGDASSVKHQQQSPVLKVEADSACDHEESQVAAKQQQSAENKPTSTTSEDSRPPGKVSPPETADRDTEEPSSVIGGLDCSLSQCKDRVHLFRLPLSLPPPGRPLPGFSFPAENKPTSTASEETRPPGKVSPPETADRDPEEPSSVIGRLDCSLSQCQPRVSLLRLPLSLPPSGRPLPGFMLIPGDTEDEVYVEVLDEDSQSHDGDVSEDFEDFTEPLSSPDSPESLQVVSCSACGSAAGSVICSSCGRGFHRDCHIPPVGQDIWSEWICSLCQDLSDPSDPYSSGRPQSPASPCLSLLDQRKCETLLLRLKVEGCRRLPEVGDVWSHLTLISERLSLRRSPPYQTAAEFLSDIWGLFTGASSQNDHALNKLQEMFHIRLTETFGSELMPPRSERGATSADLHQLHLNPAASQSRLKETRKRLRDFLSVVGPFKKTKTDRMEE
ncbi:transcription intermediary factor 1-alpha isoform X2 [Trachinotus anak]|uniref:transcription intermediary factor 1-alpha isoform X2 n=1 Tax=Trachinotus anak TaxID=443729 RepID=UPI0039F1C111